MTAPYSGAVRRALSVALVAVAIVSVAAAAAPAADRADASVFGGLGTWVDIYDGAVYAAPERTAQRMASRDVRTAWVETANFGASVDETEIGERGARPTPSPGFLQQSTAVSPTCPGMRRRGSGERAPA